MHISRKKLKEAIEAGHGNLYKIAKDLDVSISDLYRQIHADKELLDTIKFQHEITIERIFDNILDQSLSGDLRAVQLLLKYSPQSKAKGWLDEQKITIRDEKPLTAEEKEQLKKDLFGQ